MSILGKDYKNIILNIFVQIFLSRIILYINILNLFYSKINCNFEVYQQFLKNQKKY